MISALCYLIHPLANESETSIRGGRRGWGSAFLSSPTHDWRLLLGFKTRFPPRRRVNNRIPVRHASKSDPFMVRDFYFSPGIPMTDSFYYEGCSYRKRIMFHLRGIGPIPISEALAAGSFEFWISLVPPPPRVPEKSSVQERLTHHSSLCARHRSGSTFSVK